MKFAYFTRNFLHRARTCVNPLILFERINGDLPWLRQFTCRIGNGSKRLLAFVTLPLHICTFRLVVLCTILIGSIASASAKLTPDQLKLLPPAAARQVSFTQDIRPILEASCIKCHGHGRSKGDFRLDTRETSLKGGESGPAVVLGDSQRSTLIELVSGLDSDNVMPKKGKKLSKEEVGLLRAWIDQG